VVHKLRVAAILRVQLSLQLLQKKNPQHLSAKNQLNLNLLKKATAKACRLFLSYILIFKGTEILNAAFPA